MNLEVRTKISNFSPEYPTETLNRLKIILSQYTKSQVKKARNIKAIFFDIDGVLSDGKIIYDETGKEIKNFSVKDGYIISHLKKAGIIVGAISGRDSGVTQKRCAELRLDFCHQGIMDKAATFEKLAKHYNLKLKEVAFIGDDINDLCVFELAGFSACPADTFGYIKERTDLTTSAKGGEGVLREVADLVLAAQDKFEGVIDSEKRKG